MSAVHRNRFADSLVGVLPGGVAGFMAALLR
jgi:gas vesicle protein